jgi:hypothetical protein
MNTSSVSPSSHHAGSPSSWGLELPQRAALASDAASAAAWKGRKYDVAVSLLSRGLEQDPESADARQNYRALLSELRRRVVDAENAGLEGTSGKHVQELARRFFTEMDHGTHHMAWMRCLAEQEMRGSLAEVMAQMRQTLEAKKSGHHGARRSDILLANFHGAIAMGFDPTHHTNLPYPLARLCSRDGQERTRILRMGCPVMALENNAARYTVTPEFRAHIYGCEQRGEVHLYCNHLPALTTDELATLREGLESEAAASAAAAEHNEPSSQQAPWWSGASSLVRIAACSVAAIVPQRVADAALSLAETASSAIGVTAAYASSLGRRARHSERAIERMCYSEALQRFAAGHAGAFKILQLSPDLPAITDPQGTPSEAMNRLLQVILNENRELVAEILGPQQLEIFAERCQGISATFFPENTWPESRTHAETFAPAALLLMSLLKDSVRLQLHPRWCNSTCKDGIDRGGVFNAIDLLLQLDRTGDFNDPERRTQWLASLHASAWEVKKQTILRNRHAPLQQLVAHLEQMDPQLRMALLAPIEGDVDLSAEFFEGEVLPEADGWKRATSWTSLDEAGFSSSSPSSLGGSSSGSPASATSPSTHFHPAL